VQDEVLKEIRRNPALTLIATLPAHNGRSLYVFGREAAFGGWVSAQGLAPLEGPFRWADNRMVRWGLGPETRLVVRSPAVRSGALEFSGLTMRRDNAIQVIVNGTVAGQMPLRASRVFRTASFPVTWQSGENVVALRYAVWEPGSDGSGAAVLFKVLRAR
jgi:hypothetical protein